MKTPTTPTTLNSIKELEYFEKISPKCSDKYVPIYTSKLVKELSKSFKFDFAGRYYKGLNSHFAVLSKGNDIKLYIENSFDRSLSLRVSFKYNRFVFGFVKQVHLGESAQAISEHYSEISSLYDNATTVIDSLTRMKLTQEDQLNILELAFKARNISLKRVNNIKQYLDANCNAIEFIESVLDLIENGGIEVKDTKLQKGLVGGKTRFTKPSKNSYLKIRISKKIYEYLKDAYVELYI